jgi:hypothetical protein
MDGARAEHPERCGYPAMHQSLATSPYIASKRI